MSSGQSDRLSTRSVILRADPDSSTSAFRLDSPPTRERRVIVIEESACHLWIGSGAIRKPLSSQHLRAPSSPGKLSIACRRRARSVHGHTPPVHAGPKRQGAVGARSSAKARFSTTNPQTR
jgi:hypothetical protein